MDHLRGLTVLRNSLPQEALRDFLIYEAQLRENLAREKFGHTSKIAAERSMIIDRLNRLALEVCGASFNEMCLVSLNWPTDSELERIIRQTNSFLDVAQWRLRLGQIEGQVCRIEIETINNTTYGTGFLLGPDIVMTNHHVVEAIIESERGRTTRGAPNAIFSEARLRFDYKRLPDGTTLHPGTEYRLSPDNWLVDSSPNSPADRLPRFDELDYALLRTNGAPGNEPLGGHQADANAPQRGWITLSKTQHEFAPRSPLFIVQHPQGDPLKLALDTDAIIGINSNHTRVRYRTNTEPGSSGSPCFNEQWELVALHHSGDPNFEPAFNEGIPFDAILTLLEERGIADILTQS